MGTVITGILTDVSLRDQAAVSAALMQKAAFAPWASAAPEA